MRNNGKIEDISIFTAVGLVLDGYKYILGYWVNEGSENKRFWLNLFQDLISRGLKKVSIFITDDFPGVRELIKKLYQYAESPVILYTFATKSKEKSLKEGI